jgi:protein AFG1
MQVTDIADAMLLKRLFSMWWMEHYSLAGRVAAISRSVGMVVIATSNRAPIDLYRGGINRQSFTPFLETIHRHMDVIEMTGNVDYRRRRQHNNSKQSKSTSNARAAATAVTATGTKVDAHANNDDDTTVKTDVEELFQDQQQEESNTYEQQHEEEHNLNYFWPVNSTETRDALQRIFSYRPRKDNHNIEILENIKLPVRMNRHVTIPKSTQYSAWFSFDQLCHQALGAADYLAICERYPIVIVDRVPQLDASSYNEARRFVTLIDAVYESQTRLVLATEVPLDELLLHFEATVETHDGDEEIIAMDDKNKVGDRNDDNAHNIHVKGEGGSSSSSSTTFFQTRKGEQVEWSATGRIGVSLAQLSAVQDVSFSFKRAESRLVEMNNGSWGRAIK